MKIFNRTNCLIVAINIWLKSRGRFLIGFRRSVTLNGLIPHFMVVKEIGNDCFVIDYVPKTPKRFTFDFNGDFPLLFNGEYRLRRYKLIEEIKNPSNITNILMID
ncbi:MAG: hypothetical protein PHG08_00095 [Bacilli bacterium]|nr:hypothetical protein [Bacilli bacterium]